MIEYRRVLTTGRSLCVIIPRKFARDLGLRRKDIVGILLDHNELRVKKVPPGHLGGLFYVRDDDAHLVASRERE